LDADRLKPRNSGHLKSTDERKHLRLTEGRFHSNVRLKHSFTFVPPTTATLNRAAKLDLSNTKERILDASERLFANHGFDAVSLRQITTDAGANLAAVNYHFGSKEALIAAVVGRYLEPINVERLELLSASEAAHAPDPVPATEILDSLIRPVANMARHSRRSRGTFLKLVGRCMTQSGRSLPEAIRPALENVILRFNAALKRVLPDLAEDTIHWRVHFAMGAFLFTLTQHEQLEVFSGGLCSADDLDKLLAEHIQFAGAGMTAPASR
jgi:AcrR family transcriptional regulator